MRHVKGGLSTLKVIAMHGGAITRPTFSIPDRMKEGEPVGGMLQGKKASAPEMVLSRILDKYKKQYAFRYVIPEIPGQYGLAGEKEVDFVISDGVLKPVQVDDTEFVHKTPEQLKKDEESNDRVNDYFHGYGGVPVIRINTNKLVNEEMADLTARELWLV
jgi:hypothetical protein